MNVLLMITSLVLAAETAERPTLIIVVGAPGTPEYGENFSRWADRWQRGAEQAGATCLRVGDGQSTEPPDRQRLEALLADQPKQSPEPLWLVGTTGCVTVCVSTEWVSDPLSWK